MGTYKEKNSSNYLQKSYFWEFLSMYPIILRGLILYFVDKNRYNTSFLIYSLDNVSNIIGYIHTKFQVETRTLTEDMKKNVMYPILMRATVCFSKRISVTFHLEMNNSL